MVKKTSPARLIGVISMAMAGKYQICRFKPKMAVRQTISQTKLPRPVGMPAYLRGTMRCAATRIGTKAMNASGQ